MPRLVVGVTGGIGSGKSTVCSAFAALGVPFVDADIVAREVVEPGQPALEEIRREFGSSVFLDHETLDRSALRTQVFADATAKTRLENIIHPRVRDRIHDAISNCTADYMLVCIPLLLESGAYQDIIDRVLVIDCSEETQIKRVIVRSGLTRSEVEAIMRAQKSRAERLAAADDVLLNEGDLRDITARVGELHQKYQALAATD
ncbi:MAG: dephospho-CoA kinase [Gammaproteobacteria bacterium]|nr:dephospho-CoA kinase [Gammaproteobacteria bacterium]